MYNHKLHDKFYEHFNYSGNEVMPGFEVSKDWRSIYFGNNKELACVEVIQHESQPAIKTNYFVGTDWLSIGQEAIYVSPKLDKSNAPTNYLKMLAHASETEEFSSFCNELFEVKLNLPFITVPQQNDLLTPLLAIHYLNLLKRLVKKGLKKGYYPVENNLNLKIKGKIDIASNIKKNLSRGDVLKNYCSYEEFGVNCYENRILKKGLNFIARYLSTNAGQVCGKQIKEILSFVQPAFASVNSDVQISNGVSFKLNALYKDYHDALEIAQLILKRYGFNINTIENQLTVPTPPFWINMTKLFELYVLSEIRKVYKTKVKFQEGTARDIPDYLLPETTPPFIVDAKYRPVYKDDYFTEDIRQLSGYARNKAILKKLGYITEEEQNKAVAACLIIYPDQTASEHLPRISCAIPISEYSQFYKIPLRLPLMSRKE